MTVLVDKHVQVFRVSLVVFSYFATHLNDLLFITLLLSLSLINLFPKQFYKLPDVAE